MSDNQFSIKLLNNQNVCSRLRLAILHKKPEMKEACKKHILLNAVAVFNSADFRACDKQVLEQILKMNLFSCSEVQVFEAMMSWVKSKSKADVVSKELVEAHLGDLFYQIRFASMKIEEFCVLARKYHSVLSCHFETITNIIVLPNLQTQESVKFNKSPRHVGWNEKAIVECEIEYRDEDEMGTQMVMFSTNVPLLLGSFTCGKIYAGEDEISNFMVSVKIYECNGKNESGNLFLEMNTELKSESVVLTHPIVIKPGFFYMVEMGPFPNGSYCAHHYAYKRIQLESGVIIKFYDCIMDDGDDEEEKEIGTGMIKGLAFNRI